MTKNEIRLSNLLYATKGKNGYKIMFNNGVDLGTLEVDVDGYYKYWPRQCGGYWESLPMRAIADLLDHLNTEYDRKVKDNMK